MIDPNTGNEMGKGQNDEINSKGNDIPGIKTRILHLLTFLTFELLSICFKLYEPLNVFDWSMFIMATIGICISYWSYYTLGNYYTFMIGIRKDHHIITDGPYRYFAHPGYFGQYLVIIGCIAFYNFYFVLTFAMFVYFTQMYAKRMRAEEDMLTKKFGDDYKKFVSERWRMVPGLFELLV
jgi:protein-S-isoprenylcysteine O-methyltransferase Ste14